MAGSVVMNVKRKLFFQKPYDIDRSYHLFLAAIKENLQFQIDHCPEYAKILASFGFDIDVIRSEEDLYKIPPISTLYFKKNRLFSVDEKHLFIKVTSSGTKGSQSQIGFDRNSFIYGLLMMFHFFFISQSDFSHTNQLHRSWV